MILAIDIGNTTVALGGIPQGIVASVFIGPLLVVYQSRWQGVEVEVAHAVRADNHCCLLLVEGIYYLLKCLW